MKVQLETWEQTWELCKGYLLTGSSSQGQNPATHYTVSAEFAAMQMLLFSSPSGPSFSEGKYTSSLLDTPFHTINLNLPAETVIILQWCRTSYHSYSHLIAMRWYKVVLYHRDKQNVALLSDLFSGSPHAGQGLRLCTWEHTHPGCVAPVIVEVLPWIILCSIDCHPDTHPPWVSPFFSKWVGLGSAPDHGGTNSVPTMSKGETLGLEQRGEAALATQIHHTDAGILSDMLPSKCSKVVQCVSGWLQTQVHGRTVWTLAAEKKLSGSYQQAVDHGHPLSMMTPRDVKSVKNPQSDTLHASIGSETKNCVVRNTPSSPKFIQPPTVQCVRLSLHRLMPYQFIMHETSPIETDMLLE